MVVVKWVCVATVVVGFFTGEGSLLSSPLGFSSGRPLLSSPYIVRRCVDCVDWDGFFFLFKFGMRLACAVVPVFFLYKGQVPKDLAAIFIGGKVTS